MHFQSVIENRIQRDEFQLAFRTVNHQIIDIRLFLDKVDFLLVVRCCVKNHLIKTRKLGVAEMTFEAIVTLVGADLSQELVFIILVFPEVTLQDSFTNEFVCTLCTGKLEIFLRYFPVEEVSLFSVNILDVSVEF